MKFLGQILEDEFQFEIDFHIKANNYLNIMLRPNISLGNFYQDDILLSLMPGVVFRPFGTGLGGLYIVLYPNIGWQHVTTGNAAYNNMIIGVGSEAGWSWIFRNGFTFTFGGGVLKNRPINLDGISSRAVEENIWKDTRWSVLLGYSF
jgi:hypothetical protein